MARAYLTIEDFKAGLDSRRLEVAAAAGSLQVFQNGHINRGGEIEKAKAWATAYTLPAGTFGLGAVNGSLYVFGSGSTPGGIPAGVTYMQLANPDASAMTGVVAVETFSGRIYAVAEYADTTVHHFYNGTIVADWYNGLVRASQGDLTAVALALANEIDADADVTASSVGAVITVTGAVVDDNYAITVSKEDGGSFNDETITLLETQASGGGNAEINTITLGGTFDPGDKFTVTIENNTYGAIGVTGEEASVVITHKNKIYAGSGVNLFFSAIATPSQWKNNTVAGVVNAGAGSIDMSAQASNDEDITGIGIYQNNLAIFTRNSTQVWSMDADPDANVQLQVLDNIGTRSPRTVKKFGDLDLFLLADSGIRSLRSRDSSNSATVTDVGTPIDDLIITAMDGLTDDQITSAVAEIEPRDGRYIMSLAAVQYVFSYFPASKISAWSTYVPGVTMSDFTTLNGRLYGRAGDVIYLLGGADNDEYTTEDVIVELPYLDARSIATWKRWVGIDLILKGRWSVYVNSNPNQPDEWVLTAVAYQTSIGQMNLAMQQHSPVLKFKFVHSGDADEEAKISKIIVHYETKWAG